MAELAMPTATRVVEEAELKPPAERSVAMEILSIIQPHQLRGLICKADEELSMRVEEVVDIMEAEAEFRWVDPTVVAVVDLRIQQMPHSPL